MNASAMVTALMEGDIRALSRAITIIETESDAADALIAAIPTRASAATVIGITGSPGAGKSTLLDGLIEHYKHHERRVGVVAVDPSSSVHGGAVLGDRIRWMRHATSPNVVIRSMASRGSLGGVNSVTVRVTQLFAAAGCQPIFVETVGIGQVGADIATIADAVLVVTAPGLGDDIQMMKAGTLDFADLVILNKSDLPGAPALRSALLAELEHRGGKLLETCSIDGRGIAALVDEIERMRQEKSQNVATARMEGENRTVAEAEIVERSLALLRPRLKARVTRMKFGGSREALARRLLDEWSSHPSEFDTPL